MGAGRILLGSRVLGGGAIHGRAVDAGLLGIWGRVLPLPSRLLGAAHRLLWRHRLRVWIHGIWVRWRLLERRPLLLQRGLQPGGQERCPRYLRPRERRRRQVFRRGELQRRPGRRAGKPAAGGDCSDARAAACADAGAGGAATAVGAEPAAAIQPEQGASSGGGEWARDRVQPCDACGFAARGSPGPGARSPAEWAATAEPARTGAARTAGATTGPAAESAGSADCAATESCTATAAESRTATAAESRTAAAAESRT